MGLYPLFKGHHVKKLILLLSLISLNLLANEIDNDFVVNGVAPQPQGKIFLVGKVKFLAIRLNTTNDNMLLGATEFGGLATGDDRGNTAGFDGKIMIEGEDGSIEVVAKSNLFTRLVSNKDLAPEKDRWTYAQKFVEQNAINFKMRILKNELGGAYLIIGAGLEQIKDQEMISGKIQQWWHKTWLDSGFIQYQNEHENKDKLSVTATAGLGKEIKTGEDYESKFFLVAEGEVEVNASHPEESKIKSALTFRIDSKNLNHGIPGSVFKISANHAYRFDGVNEFDILVEFAWVLCDFEHITIAPHLGVGYTYNQLDEEYNNRGELIFTLGFTAYIR
jgi:hypothetical protein